MVETGKPSAVRCNGGNHVLFCCDICGSARGRRTLTCREWSRAGSEWAGARMQHHSALGLDRNESRPFTVSSGRLAHESGSGRACPVAEITEVRHTDRRADEMKWPRRYPQRNNYVAAVQGCGEHSFWSEACMVHHPRCRRSGRSGAPWRELLQETA